MSGQKPGSFGHIFGRIVIGMVGGAAVGGPPGLIVGALTAAASSMVEGLLDGGAGKQIQPPLGGGEARALLNVAAMTAPPPPLQRGPTAPPPPRGPTAPPPPPYNRGLISDPEPIPNRFAYIMDRPQPSAPPAPLPGIDQYGPVRGPLFPRIKMLEQRSRAGSNHVRECLASFTDAVVPAYYTVVNRIRSQEPQSRTRQTNNERNSAERIKSARKDALLKFVAAIWRTDEATEAGGNNDLGRAARNAWIDVEILARKAGETEVVDSIKEAFFMLARAASSLASGPWVEEPLQGGSRFNASLIPNDVVFIANLDTGDIKWYRIDRKYLSLVKEMILDITESTGSSNAQTNIARSAANRVKTLKNKSKNGGKSKTRRSKKAPVY